MTTRAQWSVSPCPPPPGLNPYSTSVEAEVFGRQVKAQVSGRRGPLGGVRAWLWDRGVSWQRLKSCRLATKFVVGVLGTAVASASLPLAAACGLGLALGSTGAPDLGTPLLLERQAIHLLDMQGITKVDGSDVVAGSPEEREMQALVTRPVREWFEQAYLRFGPLTDTQADRRILHLWLADEMKRATVRNKDAMLWIPLVVELMFIPTLESVYASMIARSGTARILKAMGAQERF